MNDDNKIIENVKLKISISNFEKEEKFYIPQNKRNIFKSLAIACCMIICITGMAFAKEISNHIYNNFFRTGIGMGKAMNEGYIENTDMEYQNSNITLDNIETGEQIEDVDSKIKVDEFIMDNYSLSLTFKFTLSEKIKKIISTNEIVEINFPDLLIYDENNIVLYTHSGERFNDFCKEKRLDYNYENVPKEKLMNTGVDFFIENKDENEVKVIYNIYTAETPFPKSKKLKFELNKVAMSKQEKKLGDEEIILNGNWKFEIDVPEKMYNREEIVYKLESTTSDDYTFISAVTYNTETEIKLKMKADKIPEEPTCDEIEFWESLPDDDELKTVDILNYFCRNIYETEEYKKFMEERRKIFDYNIYLTNEDGERFELVVGPRENGGMSLATGSDTMEYSGMFDLTLYDNCDKITINIEHNNEKEKIVLQKNN